MGIRERQTREVAPYAARERIRGAADRNRRSETASRLDDDFAENLAHRNRAEIATVLRLRAVVAEDVDGILRNGVQAICNAPPARRISEIDLFAGQLVDALYDKAGFAVLVIILDDYNIVITDGTDQPVGATES